MDNARTMQAVAGTVIFNFRLSPCPAISIVAFSVAMYFQRCTSQTISGDSHLYAWNAQVGAFVLETLKQRTRYRDAISRLEAASGYDSSSSKWVWGMIHRRPSGYDSLSKWVWSIVVRATEWSSSSSPASRDVRVPSAPWREASSRCRCSVWKLWYASWARRDHGCSPRPEAVHAHTTQLIMSLSACHNRGGQTAPSVCWQSMSRCSKNPDRTRHMQLCGRWYSCVGNS